MAVVYKQIRVLMDPPELTEGLGAHVKRAIGTAHLRHIDPFIFLDHFVLTPPHGFPGHPHRGFESIVYVLSGTLLYENSLGHGGALGPGDAQRMVTGRAILHAQGCGPEGAEGITLWVNQHSSTKLCQPSSIDVPAVMIPKIQVQGAIIELLSGQYANCLGPCTTSVPTQYMVVHMQAGATLQLESPEEFSAGIYVLQGELNVHGQVISHYQVSIFENTGNAILVQTQVASKFLFIQGPRIGEPIVQHGPYVMSHRDECLAAQVDFNHQQNGFEGAQQWHSRLDIR